MYTNPLTLSEKTNPIECMIKNIQGPCGNSTFASVSISNDYDGITSISRINDEQLIFEEHYSMISGTFGTVEKFHFRLNDHIVELLIRLFKVISTCVNLMIFSNLFLLKF